MEWTDGILKRFSDTEGGIHQDVERLMTALTWAIEGLKQVETQVVHGNLSLAKSIIHDTLNEIKSANF